MALTLFNKKNCFKTILLVTNNKRHLRLKRFYGISNNKEPSPRQIEFDRSKLRNIGIIAHIDAGKTTTTERILYHAGSTDTIGDVDRGNTVTDYLVQERDRGITITSAAVSFDWNKNRVNFIDTPGHVDFTIEVERSLSVLDGAVTILDASAGVEAQTITVWNQATKYRLPNVIFLNKYDKSQADYKMCMKDLRIALGIKASLIQLPIKTNQGFSSIVDVINRKQMTWIDPMQCHGSKFITESLSGSKLNQKFCDLIEEEREKLVDNLTDLDDKLASHVIECDKISETSPEMLTEALRRATLNCQLSPVLVGSSLKYIGVQQLMDAMITYLPTPVERETQIKELMGIVDMSKSKSSCAFIFKIMHDKKLGPLSYMRICNGSLSKLQRVQNLDTQKLDQVKKIYRPFADELKEIDQPVYKDDIIIATGLTNSKTGDIIISQSSDLNNRISSSTHEPPGSKEEDQSINDTESSPFRFLNEQVLVPQINRIEPVYFCTIESRISAQQLKLENALACLAREDPSFTFEIDELGITTIRGMGKLHLEVSRDRIQSEYGIDSLLGPLQISYRETIDGSATEELSVERLINSVPNKLNIRLYIRSMPNAGVWSGKALRLDTSGESSLGRLRSDHRKAIENGFLSALSSGPSMGYPLIDCDILLLDFTANRRCTLPVISSTASQCLTNAILRCTPVLLEPIMLLEAVVPTEFNGIVLGDISTRRGVVLSTSARNNGSIVIRAHTPLVTLADYSEFLRISTSGRGSFSMELFNYRAMSEADKQSVVRL